MKSFVLCGLVGALMLTFCSAVWPTIGVALAIAFPLLFIGVCYTIVSDTNAMLTVRDVLFIVFLVGCLGAVVEAFTLLGLLISQF